MKEVRIYSPPALVAAHRRATTLAGVFDGDGDGSDRVVAYVAHRSKPHAIAAGNNAGVLGGTVSAWKDVTGTPEVRELVEAGLLATPAEVIVIRDDKPDAVVRFVDDPVRGGIWDVVGRFQHRLSADGEPVRRVILFADGGRRPVRVTPVRVTIEFDADTPPEVLETLRRLRVQVSPIFGTEQEKAVSAGGFIVEV